MSFSKVTTKIGSNQNSQMPNKRGYDMAVGGSFRQRALCWQGGGYAIRKMACFRALNGVGVHSMNHPNSQQMMRSNGMQCTGFGGGRGFVTTLFFGVSGNGILI